MSKNVSFISLLPHFYKLIHFYIVLQSLNAHMNKMIKVGKPEENLNDTEQLLFLLLYMFFLSSIFSTDIPAYIASSWYNLPVQH